MALGRRLEPLLGSVSELVFCGMPHPIGQEADPVPSTVDCSHVCMQVWALADAPSVRSCVAPNFGAYSRPEISRSPFEGLHLTRLAAHFFAPATLRSQHCSLSFHEVVMSFVEFAVARRHRFRTRLLFSVWYIKPLPSTASDSGSAWAIVGSDNMRSNTRYKVGCAGCTFRVQRWA